MATALSLWMHHRAVWLLAASLFSTHPATDKIFTFSHPVKKHSLLYRKALLYITICSGFASACYSVALVLMNGLIPLLISTLTKAEVMEINTYLLMLDFCALPFCGWLASRIPRAVSRCAVHPCRSARACVTPCHGRGLARTVVAVPLTSPKRDYPVASAAHPHRAWHVPAYGCARAPAVAPGKTRMPRRSSPSWPTPSNPRARPRTKMWLAVSYRTLGALVATSSAQAKTALPAALLLRPPRLDDANSSHRQSTVPRRRG